MPLDPRSRDYAIRTVYGEDPTLSAEAVANVIRNRTIAGRYGGNDVQSVVLSKNQFEPWNNPEARARMQGLNPNDPEYQRLGSIVDKTWSGDTTDPTNGATHFYAPKAQAALGRNAPAWAQGEGQQIGPHVFYSPEGRVSRAGDAEGPPEAPPMMSAFSGAKRSMNPMNYAMSGAQTPEEIYAAARRNGMPQQEAAPSLSSRFINNGPGVLFSDNPNDPGQQATKTLPEALQQGGLFLRDDPAALGALGALNKDKEGAFQFVQGKDGRLFRVNKKNGMVQAVEGRGSSKEQDAWDTAQGKSLSEQSDKIIQASEAARARLGVLQQARALVDNPAVYQGGGGSWVLEAKKIGSALGMNVEGIPETELLNSIAKQATLELRNPAGGAGMPGALSDQDRKFLEKANYGLDNTAAGNRKVIDYAARIAQRNIDVEGQRQAYIQQNGRLDQGFSRHLAEWSSKNHLFADAQEQKAPSGGQRRPLSAFSQ